MAASISNMLIPSLSKALQHEAYPSSTDTNFSATTLTCLTQKPLSPQNRTSVKCKASSNEIDSFILSSVAELQRKHEQEMQPKTPQADQAAHHQVEDIWREIHGGNNWVGLLDPIHPLLRSELIRYGEMAQACYDAFVFDPYSKYCNSCRFTRPNFFDCLGMTTHLGYHVTRYLYFTLNVNLPNMDNKPRLPKLWSKHANWVGYVAVSDDATSKRLGRRDIAVAWRGTVTRLEWIADQMDRLVPVSSRNIPCSDPAVKVKSGLLELYTDNENTCQYSKYSAREQVLTEVKRLVEMYSDEELCISITGHGLGSALAILSAYDMVESGLNTSKDGWVVPVSVFSFSGPKVGNVRFKKRVESLGLKVLRVVNVHDVVPKGSGLTWSYSHVGMQLELDHRNSPFLNPDADVVCAHNLEALLHLLDGYHGRGYEFVLASGRDPALVNKACDFLRDYLLVPPYWRQDSNKGMIKNKEGRWVKPDWPKLEAGHPDDQHLRQLEMSPKARATANQQVADVWSEIHGKNDWAGLLEPIHPLLRSELIRYGEMAQACHDAFDYEAYSVYCGSCKFTRSEFFKSLGMNNHLGYQVTRYLYVSLNPSIPQFFWKSRLPKLWSKHANWAGYITVSDDHTSKRIGRRDITIAWQGTVTDLKWDQLIKSPVSISSRNIPCPDPTVKVESGFLELYTSKEDSCEYGKYSAREQFLTEVKQLVEKYSDEELSITVTGHSMGSALAILGAYDIVETGLNVRKDGRVVPVSVFSFSGPKVGNVSFRERVELLGVKVLRVVNVRDPVPKIPGLFLNEQAPPMLRNSSRDLLYSHVGVELELDPRNSPFLNPEADGIRAHNLEALLHLLDGYHKRGFGFVLASGRDPALVNKDSDFLKDHLLVPPYWRRDGNKGMVKNKDGRWEQPKRQKPEGHPEDMRH